MKKLFILNLALAMASIALADLSLFYEAGTVTLVGSDYTAAEPITCFLAVSCTTEVPVLLYEGTGSGITYPPPDGIDYYETLLGLDPNTLENVYMVTLMDTTEPYSIPNGDLLMMTITGPGDVYLLDESGTLLDQVTPPACRYMLNAAEQALYDRYEAAGEDPSSWCCQYQCYGDADCEEDAIIFITGWYHRIYQQDLNLLIISWMKNPETGAIPGADFNRAEETVFISGTYSVYQADLNIMIKNWRTTTADLDEMHGDGSPGSGACPTYLPE